MNVKDQKKLYFPAFVILMAVFVMLIMMGLSTVGNINRQKDITRKLIHLEGLTILQALEVGVLSHTVMHQLGLDAIEYLAQEIPHQNDAIAYIYILDTDGKIIHASGSGYRPDAADTWKRLQASHQGVTTRIRQHPDGTAIYELASRMNLSDAILNDDDERRPDLPREDTHHQQSSAVVGIKMTMFDNARRDDIHHAIFMLVIVVALGASAVYFIYVINRYFRTNRVLEETQAYSRQVVASLANGLLSIDPAGRVVSFNQPALDLLGTTGQRIENAPLDSFLDFETTGIDNTLKHGQPNLEREIVYKTAMGSIPLAVSVTPIRMDENKLHGAVIVLRDLREIKALENQMRQAEKLAAVGKLAASVAHEIRNPLSSIKGFARFLEKSIGRTPEEGQYARVIVEEVDRINTVVNDLLTLSRPASLQKAPLNVAKLFNHVVMLMEPDTAARDIRIEICLDATNEMIEADVNQLTQALLNLLLNAFHAVATGDVITLGLDRESKSGYDCIYVRDTGAGISPDIFQRIFDPFFTTHKTGTGLGLAIVHQIVENHHGVICVESPPKDEDRGSQFSIYLPCEKPPANGSTAPQC